MLKVIGETGNKPHSIGQTWTKPATAANATTSVQYVEYGDGWWFGGRTQIFYFSSPVGTISTLSTATVPGGANSDEKPSYQNGQYIVPSGSVIRAGTVPSAIATRSTATFVISRVLWRSSDSKYYAFNRNGTVIATATAITGGWTNQTTSGAGTAQHRAAATDGTIICVGNSAGAIIYSTSGNAWATATSTPTSQFGTSPIRNMRYHPIQNIWTACTGDGKVGYSASGTSGWSLLTVNLTTATVDFDIFPVNNRWVAVGSDAGGVKSQASISATNSITSTYTAFTDVTTVGNNSCSQWASDGNYVIGVLGTAIYYMR